MKIEHLDAAESVFFERELEHIYSTTYDIKYPELKARMFVPVSNAAPSGSTEVTYRQFDRRGQARIIIPGATDSPRVDVLGTEFTRPVRYAGASYGYNLIEIRQSQLHGKALDSRKAAAARRAVEEVIDEVASLGAADYGIPTGFINDPNVTVEASAGVWSSAAADDMIADIAKMWTGIDTTSKGVEKPDTLLLPDAQYTIAATKPRSTQSDTTVLEFLLRAFPGLSMIEPWYRLDQAGAASKDRAILYKRSAEYLVQDIPNEFEQLPVFQKGSNFEIETWAATAGLAWYYPKSARYMDGI